MVKPGDRRRTADKGPQSEPFPSREFHEDSVSAAATVSSAAAAMAGTGAALDITSFNTSLCTAVVAVSKVLVTVISSAMAPAHNASGQGRRQPLCTALDASLGIAIASTPSITPTSTPSHTSDPNPHPHPYPKPLP